MTQKEKSKEQENEKTATEADKEPATKTDSAEKPIEDGVTAEAKKVSSLIFD